MTSPIITLTTDFGAGSHYVAQMKASILRICRHAQIVDITHEIGPQQILHGALVLEDVSPWFPVGTIHVGVVDPGVGTDRAILGMHAGNRLFVAPDNGLLTFIARRWPPARVVELDNPAMWHADVSATFHGRDIMAPVAAHLANGVGLDECGRARSQWQQIDFPAPVREADRVRCTCLYADHFGNVVTNVTRAWLEAESMEVVAARIQGHLVPCVRTYGEAPPGSLVVLFGSSDRLEVAAVNGHAARQANLAPGDPIVLDVRPVDVVA